MDYNVKSHRSRTSFSGNMLSENFMRRNFHTSYYVASETEWHTSYTTYIKYSTLKTDLSVFHRILIWNNEHPIFLNSHYINFHHSHNFLIIWLQLTLSAYCNIMAFSDYLWGFYNKNSLFFICCSSDVIAHIKYK